MSATEPIGYTLRRDNPKGPYPLGAWWGMREDAQAEADAMSERGWTGIYVVPIYASPPATGGAA